MQSEIPFILKFHYFYHTEIMCIDIFNHIVEVLNEYLSDIVPRKRMLTNSDEDEESEYTYMEEKTDDESNISGYGSASNLDSNSRDPSQKSFVKNELNTSTVNLKDTILEERDL